MSFDNIASHFQFQTHAFADPFGGKKRIENFWKVLAGDFDTIIIDPGFRQRIPQAFKSGQRERYQQPY